MYTSFKVFLVCLNSFISGIWKLGENPLLQSLVEVDREKAMSQSNIPKKYHTVTRFPPWDNGVLKKRQQQCQHLPFLKKFTIVSTHLVFVLWPIYPGANIVGVVLTFRKRRQNQLSSIHILHKALTVIISHCCFVEDNKEMYQSLQCSCRASVLLIETSVFWRSCCRYCCRCLRSLVIFSSAPPLSPAQ